MPQPPEQDLVTAVDFTTQNPITASILNQALSTLQGNNSNSLACVSLVLKTVDTALGIPNVPDAASTVKWQDYPWLRVPFASDPSTEGTLYVWNDGVVSDATYLKWVTTAFDPAAIEADIAAAQTDATTALSTANSIAGTAATALTNSATALSTATTASSSAATAITNAATAQAAAVTAQTTADSALAANKLVTQITASATAGDRIRTNAAATANEYFHVKDTIAILQDVKATNTTGDALVTTVYTKRTLNTEITDTGGIVSIASSVFTLQTGTYKLKATCPLNNDTATAYSAFSRIYNNTDAAVAILGLTRRFYTPASGGALTFDTFVEGVVTITTAKAFELQTYVEGAGTITGGAAMNIGALSERYSQLYIEKLA